MTGVGSSQSNVPSKFLICHRLLEVSRLASGEICKSEIFRSQKNSYNFTCLMKMMLDLLRMSLPPHKSFLALKPRLFSSDLLNSFSHFTEGRTLEINIFLQFEILAPLRFLRRIVPPDQGLHELCRVLNPTRKTTVVAAETPAPVFSHLQHIWRLQPHFHWNVNFKGEMFTLHQPNCPGPSTG